MKPAKCKVCHSEFIKRSPFQKWCSVECGAVLAVEALTKKKARQQAAERKQTREKLRKMKSKTQVANEVQAVVNKYVRLRDFHLGCISCDKPATWDGQWHASHFRSRGAASALRFNLWNIHKSCSVCNNHKSGNLAEYEPRLRKKIGDEKVDWLKNQNRLAKFSTEYLYRLKSVFAKKIKRLERRMS